MYSSNFLKIALLVILAVGFVGIGSAQDNKPPEGPPQGAQQPADAKPKDPRAEALRQLGLTKEQMLQIRLLNVERKPLMDAAQKRLREANKALDETIYADNVSDPDVQARLKDVHAAQAEVVRIRSMNELAVRRILTPEQLGHFRELRQQFEQAARENMQNKRVINNNGVVNRTFRPNALKSAQPGQPQGRPVNRSNPPRPNL